MVVRKEFADIFARGQYAIFSRSIPIDSIVYSAAEFEKLSQDSSSFLAQNLHSAIEL